MKNNFYRCYSRKLNDFLRATGIKFKSEGAHVTGLQISTTGGITWEDYTNIHKANEAHPEISLDELAELRDKSLNELRAPVKHEPTGLLINRRVRIFKVYENDDKLSYALKQWNKTKPKK